MEAVKQWGFSLCAAMVACGIAHMMLPKSNLEKMFRMVVSVFFICAILSPIVLRDTGLMVDIAFGAEVEIADRSGRVAEVADRQTLDRMRADLEKMIADKLSQKGIKVREVTININTSGQNSVQITSAEVLIASEHREQLDTISVELESELGCPVRIECL